MAIAFGSKEARAIIEADRSLAAEEARKAARAGMKQYTVCCASLYGGGEETDHDDEAEAIAHAISESYDDSVYQVVDNDSQETVCLIWQQVVYYP